MQQNADNRASASSLLALIRSVVVPVTLIAVLAIAAQLVLSAGGLGAVSESSPPVADSSAPVPATDSPVAVAYPELYEAYPFIFDQEIIADTVLVDVDGARPGFIKVQAYAYYLDAAEPGDDILALTIRDEPELLFDRDNILALAGGFDAKPVPPWAERSDVSASDGSFQFISGEFAYGEAGTKWLCLSGATYNERYREHEIQQMIGCQPVTLPPIPSDRGGAAYDGDGDMAFTGPTDFCPTEYAENSVGCIGFTDGETFTSPDCSTGNGKPNLAVRLRGHTGDEIARVVTPNAEPVELSPSKFFEIQSLSISGLTGDPSEITIEFTNDLYRRTDRYDRNLTVDWIELCGTRYETSEITTESVGARFNSETYNCRTQHFGAGETLFCNGYFTYGADPTNPTMIDVTVRARGTSGEEILNVTNNGAAIDDLHLTTSFEDYAFTVSPGTSVSDLLFAFNNDKYIPGVVDRNVMLTHIVFDGQTIDTLAPRTFIQGLYKHGSCMFGNNFYLQTNIIHCDGSFNFNRGAPSLGD